MMVDLSRIREGAAALINGKRYTVVRVSGMGLELKGARGGDMALVINIHDGHATLCNYYRSDPVESFQLLLGGDGPVRRSRSRRTPQQAAPRALPALGPAPVVPPMAAQQDLATERDWHAFLAASREYQEAERRSKAAMERRRALPPGSSRARVTTANANWARSAEHRDRIFERLRAEWEARRG